MSYNHKKIADVATLLKKRLEKNPTENVLRSTEIRSLYAEIPLLDEKERASFGQEVNKLKAELERILSADQTQEKVEPIDVTAPFDINSKQKPELLTPDKGSRHPLSTEISKIADIFYRMGFNIEESRQIDDEYHMFDSLNFPPGHPARDDYDTFTTEEGLIAPAHTSTMQNRLLQKYRSNLEDGRPIAVLIPDRVFRNEDLDARHEHTFYQHEGIFVDKGIHAGNLVATLQTFLQEYYEQEIDVKTQPFYFPFTEPSFEFALSCPFCQKKGCSICSQSGWIELLGCGMIHPNVLKMAGINPDTYTGFAWGGGIERLVMMKYNIEDIRHFESGKIDFLRQFS